MADSTAALAAKFQNASKDLKSSQRAAVTRAGETARVAMQGAAEAANTKGITTRLKAFTSSATGEGVAVKYGPNPGWVIIMNDRTQPHFIGPSGKGRGGSLKRQNLSSGLGGKGRRSARGGRALLGLLGGSGAGLGGGRGSPAIDIKGIGVRAYAMHPGTKGKHFAGKGIKAAEPLATKVYQADQHRQLGKWFHG